MTDSTPEAQALDILQSRASTYAFLSVVYRQEAPIPMLGQIADQLAGAAEEAESEGQRTLREYVASMDRSDMESVRTELAAEYAALFLNAGPSPVYVYESVYTNPEHLVMQKARDEVLGEYRKEGLDRISEFHEPEDHIAIELEFMGYLCQKAAEALEAGDAQGAVRYLDKQDHFLHKHLLVWVPEFCAGVLQNAQTGFYRGIGQLTDELLKLEDETITELIEALSHLSEG